MNKADIQSIIRDTINETLVKQQDNADRSACRTYSSIAKEASDKFEMYQKRNETVHARIIDKLDTHLERYEKDREESRTNNEAIFTQLKELTLEVKKNSEENSVNSSFRLANEAILASVNNGMITMKTNRAFILWVAGVVGAISTIIYFAKQIFKN